MGLKILPVLFIWGVFIIFFKIGEIVHLYVNKMIQYGGKNRLRAEWGEGVLLSSDLCRLELCKSGNLANNRNWKPVYLNCYLSPKKERETFIYFINF